MNEAERAAETEKLTRDFAKALLDRLREPDGFDTQEFDVVDETVLIDALTLLAGGAAILPPGWRIVPEEPTEEMLAAGRSAFRSYCLRYMEGHPAVWDAMLSAAPTPPAAAEEKHDG